MSEELSDKGSRDKAPGQRGGVNCPSGDGRVSIKLLRTMGYKVNTEPFKNHSWYFRNALVRDNCEDVTWGISPEMVHLERCFENLPCGTNHELRNRYVHLDWPRGRLQKYRRTIR